MNRIENWVLGVGLSLLAACTTNPLPGNSPLALNALEFYEWASGADDASRSRMEAQLLDSNTQQNAVIALIQLALLRSVTGGETADRQVLDLLGSVQKTRSAASREAGYRSFAQLWQQYLEARMAVSESKGRIDELEAQRQALREQIEALTTIEQQLNRRSTP